MVHMFRILYRIDFGPCTEAGTGGFVRQEASFDSRITFPYLLSYMNIPVSITAWRHEGCLNGIIRDY